ncbi:MAG: phage terminase large subunit [Rhodospirillaceae bacterium]|nr:phage terminase large subunit [Rhodospirillaceae bacterium]
MSKAPKDFHLSAALNALCRSDFKPFAHKSFNYLNPGKLLSPNWAFECVAHHLELCVKAGLKRLIICLPPRHLKSLLGSVALPAWYHGRDPNKRIICVSYNQELAKKFHQDCHHLMESDFYQSIFPGTHLAEKPNNDQEYATTGHGFRLATSVGGTLVGRGGDMIIIDDPIKPTDAQSESERKKLHGWFSDSLITRLDNPAEGVVVILTQRTHPDDLVGYVKDMGDWAIIKIPAIGILTETYAIGPGEFYTRQPGTLIDPSRMSWADIEAIKKSMTEYFFAAQYQQEPYIQGGGMIKFDWFPRNDPLPLAAYDFVVQFWDTASEVSDLNDFSVCGTFGVIGHRYFLIDMFRARVDYAALKAAAIKLIQKWQPNMVVVEKSGVGPALRADLRAFGYSNVEDQSPRDNKVARVMAQLHKMHQGRVHLPLEAPWIKDFREEVIQFPNGKHDDQIDVLEAFLRSVDGARRLLSSNGFERVCRSFPNGILPGVPEVKVTTFGDRRRLVDYSQP